MPFFICSFNVCGDLIRADLRFVERKSKKKNKQTENDQRRDFPTSGNSFLNRNHHSRSVFFSLLGCACWSSDECFQQNSPLMFFRLKQQVEHFTRALNSSQSIHVKRSQSWLVTSAKNGRQLNGEHELPARWRHRVNIRWGQRLGIPFHLRVSG